MSGADQPLTAAATARAWALACMVLGLAHAAPLPADRGSGQAIVVRAAEATESENGTVLTVHGEISLRAPEWQLHAESGRIEGPLEDPELIAVAGAPARIIVQRVGDSEHFEGTSHRIEFRPRIDAVRLEGGAVVVKGQQSIRSGSIDYALENDTFTAGLGGRVRVVTTPRARDLR